MSPHLGEILMLPTEKPFFAGQLLIDTDFQVRRVIEPEEKWRGPGPLSYHQTKIFGCLAEMSLGNRVFTERSKVKELWLEDVATRDRLPVSYLQWSKVVSIENRKPYPDQKELKKNSFYYEVQTEINGLDEHQFFEMDAAVLLDLECSFTLFDLYKFGVDAFYEGRFAAVEFENFWAARRAIKNSILNKRK